MKEPQQDPERGAFFPTSDGTAQYTTLQQPAPPEGQLSAPAPPPPQPSVEPVHVIVVTQQVQPSSKICGTCNQPFNNHVSRCGINVSVLILIIVLSLFIPFFLVALCCFFEQYSVCPHCRHFSGHADSNGTNVCFC